jgi:hypothetical protein
VSARTDFNDLAHERGFDAVRAYVNGARKPAAVEPEADRRVVVTEIADLLGAAFPPRDMLLSPWLESQSLTMIHAWRGVGKTHVALGLAYALASGGEFLEWRAEQPTKVLYIDGEMPGAALRERVARIVASSNKEAAPGFLRFVTPDLQPDGVMPNLATREGQQAINDVLGDARVIVVDNLSCLVRGGKENEGESWQPVAEWALRMRARGRCVIFIHHSGKSGAQRGTSKREDLLDTVLLLRRPADYQAAEGARFEIHFEKARALFGQDVAPIEVTLQATPDGRQTWTTRTVKGALDAQMIELAELGLHQAEIARELGCNRSTVMRGLNKAKNEGRFIPTMKPRSGGRDD